jgi:hypothetical protein
MRVLEWIIWSIFFCGAVTYALGIYLNIKRFGKKIEFGVYAWCFFLFGLSLVFVFSDISKLNMLWIAPAGFLLIYSTIFVAAFIKGLIKGVTLSGKGGI